MALRRAQRRLPRFGPDGYLYLGTGDGSGIADGRKPGRTSATCWRRSCASTWTSPTRARTTASPPTIRSSDPRGPGRRSGRMASGSRGSSASTGQTGDLWAGEVGQDLWEIGLQDREGRQLRLERQRGHPSVPPRAQDGARRRSCTPIVEHPHSEFRSLTGGYVYHGKRLPELAGPTFMATSTPAGCGCCATTARR